MSGRLRRNSGALNDNFWTQLLLLLLYDSCLLAIDALLALSGRVRNWGDGECLPQARLSVKCLPHARLGV